MTKRATTHSACCFFLLLCAIATFAQSAAEGELDARADSSRFARQLGSTDAIARQRAAEALARLAATDQKKLVEGYQLQEKNKKVRLALDWALYRMGKPEALFRIVRDLDSSRHDQAVRYLTQLDSPVLLHEFLKQEDNAARITVGLLEALARTGDAQSLELIKPFRDSFGLGVAEAAELAADQIETRLAQSERPTPTRPRSVGKTEQTEP